MAVLLQQTFGERDWVVELSRFNIRYVEQLGSLMTKLEGRIALSQLQLPLPELSSVYDRVNDVLAQEGLTLASPYAASSTAGLA